VKKTIITLLLFLFVFSLTAQEGDTSRTAFLLKTGTSIGITGYTLTEKGYENEEELEVEEETEHLPGFILNTVQLGAGIKPLSNVFLAFVPGIWFSETFDRFAFTPASLLCKVSLFNKEVSPILSVQGGIFIEQPVSAFGMFANPAVGVEFINPNGPDWYIDCGYLVTYWSLEDGFIDTTERYYFNYDESIRHSVSISAGMMF